jgi:hypothetical protein
VLLSDAALGTRVRLLAIVLPSAATRELVLRVMKESALRMRGVFSAAHIRRVGTVALKTAVFAWESGSFPSPWDRQEGPPTAKENDIDFSFILSSAAR